MTTRLVIFTAALLLISNAASAQVPQPPGVTEALSFAAAPSGAQAAGVVSRSGRGGFTLLLNMGFGIQNDLGIEESARGLAGLNLGVGGFVNEKIAVMFRISGTNVSYDFGLFGELDQISGVAGPSLQYWATDRLTLEAGGGFGFWQTPGDEERGFGLILGAGAVLLSQGKHNLQVGVEYAPAFTDGGSVHNLGITFGYQFHSRR